MKQVTATFARSEDVDAAVAALNDADIPDSDIVVEDLGDGKTTVSVMVDDSKLDAAAAILNAGSSANVEDRDEEPRPVVEGHPDGSGPVVMPIVPNR